MHRSKIEWVDDVWNPVTGCLHECRYCYARRRSRNFSGDIRRNMAADVKKDDKLYILDKPFPSETGGILTYPFGFLPTLHRYRLDYPTRRKNGCDILVGEAGELFGNWIPDQYIKEILERCVEHPEHNYMFLTKNPDRYSELDKKGIIPCGDNFWYGFSYTSSGCATWDGGDGRKHCFACADPLLGDIEGFGAGCPPVAEWVIIGAETGNGQKVVTPKKAWIVKILEHCDKHKIPVFMKDSLIPIVGEDNMRREYPPLKKHISQKVKEHLEGKCCSCGRQVPKNEMLALCARAQRGVQPKLFAHMCEACFQEFEIKYKPPADGGEIGVKVKRQLNADCYNCKGNFRKKQMIAICVRRRRGEFPQQFTYMCKKCFLEFCKEHQINVPELQNLEEGECVLEECGGLCR